MRLSVATRLCTAVGGYLHIVLCSRPPRGFTAAHSRCVEDWPLGVDSWARCCSASLTHSPVALCCRRCDGDAVTRAAHSRSAAAEASAVARPTSKVVRASSDQPLPPLLRWLSAGGGCCCVPRPCCGQLRVGRKKQAVSATPALHATSRSQAGVQEPSSTRWLAYGRFPASPTRAREETGCC